MISLVCGQEEFITDIIKENTDNSYWPLSDLRSCQRYKFYCPQIKIIAHCSIFPLKVSTRVALATNALLGTQSGGVVSRDVRTWDEVCRTVGVNCLELVR